ncbi:hypothetical protein HG535_0E00240 [Zygotorulaspora mrakii]|uniref:Elongator complex protein 6 n=1 Tax=Zygotorulaspora mrakii TaxID=42260 RepID=A0A7H9B2T6_ZYGMR|nr:uncharacterized protein HG535_0E00240 [Zygotorulaspora mrakii]QLG72940.1 hypothetical protein HG535_0E00240 [Zygotorulaspora mrakii]
MTNVQRQDLVVFDDNSVISSALFSKETHSLISIASAPVTSPFWLISAIMEDLTLGVSNSFNETTESPPAKKYLGPITLVSFIHNAKYFANAFSKIKIPPSSYKVVDLLTDFVLKNSGMPNHKVLSNILKSIPDNQSSVIILEQPEILLSLLDGLTSDDLHRKLINPVMRRCKLLVVTTKLRSLIQETKDGIEASRFTACTYYKSMAILSLRPLETGRAKDVTGCLRITRGGSANTLDCQVQENEYLYFNQKENTRLFYR